MSTYELGLMNGDGIGEEVVPATAQLLEAATGRFGVTIDWVPVTMGWEAIHSHGDAIPAETLARLSQLEGWVTGPHDSAAYPEEHKAQLNPSGRLRREFSLFANIRPAKNLPNIPAVTSGTDLVVARENTEGFYGDRNMYWGHGESMPTKDVALATGVFTRPAIERIAHEACRLAESRKRHLTIVHKANVLRNSTGMFRDICREIATQYDGLEVDDFHIDAMTAHLVRRSADFDVIVTENMFGDILSDLAGELVGALGLAGSINAGTDHAMAQAAHGSAPDIAGEDKANPIGMMTSGWMLLGWLARRHDDEALAKAAEAAENALMAALRAGAATADLGGSLGTRAFTDAVITQLTEG